MGWNDFLNRNPIGKAFSNVASSTIDSVDNVVQKGFTQVEHKIDSFDKKGQALGGAIDNVFVNFKSIKSHGLDRNHLDEIYESKKVLDETLPNFIKTSKPYKNVSNVVETSKKITNAVDIIHEIKYK